MSGSNKSQVVIQRSWDNAESGMRMVEPLSVTDISALSVAVNSPVCGLPFDGLRVVSQGLADPSKAADAALGIETIFQCSASCASAFPCSPGRPRSTSRRGQPGPNDRNAALSAVSF